jgi:hypothetical protein
MNKRPKLFYTPGMISLLVVPVLFYFYQPVIKYKTQIKFILPKDDHRSPDSFGYTNSMVKAYLKGKKINTVYLGYQDILNDKKFEFIAQEALKLKFYHDTTQVIKVHLSEETTYGEFVQLVNIMVRDRLKRYSWMDDDFYIFGEEPPHSEEPPQPERIKPIYL